MPRFFLAGFTGDGTKEGRLPVSDLKTGRRWWSDPNGAGHQRDFYRIDLKGYDPLEVERAFQQIEDAAAPALHRLVETDQPSPLGEGALNVLPLLASLVIRVPTSRRRVETASERIVRASFPKALPRLPLPPPELHSRIFGHLPPGAIPTPEEYEASMVKFFEDEVLIEIDQTWTIGHMLSAFGLVLDRLAQLHWTVAVLQAGSPDFISSDNPVSFRSAGSNEASAVVAISRRTALVGSLHAPERLVIHPDGRFAALVNGLTVDSSEQFVFSCSEQVLWKKEDGSQGCLVELPRR